MNDRSDADLAMLVQAHRRRTGLTQEALAQLSGLSVRTIRNLERGRTVPRRDSVALLVETLRLHGHSEETFRRAAAARPAERLAGGPSVPNQLPPDVPDFTGRESAVAMLAAAVSDGRTTVAVVSGRAGVGKTALAVHVAHLVRARFPDGVLCASLRGSEAAPREPAEVLASLLRALGTSDRALPETLDARAEQYRLLLADRRVLVVLDGAESETQVRPLLPGGAACAAVVTSRTGLGGLEGAWRLELEVMTPPEARALLARVAGEDRVALEPGAAARIVRRCGQLPLAVRIAGARLAARRHWRLADLAGRLEDPRRCLDELVQGDLDVRASLELSYRALDPVARCAFRRLGLLDGPVFPAWAAGLLLGLPAAAGVEAMDALVDARLLGAIGPDHRGHVRYGFDDLVRLFARERALAEEPAGERVAVVDRALGAWRRLAEEDDEEPDARPGWTRGALAG